jgi:hypothetical protein
VFSFARIAREFGWTHMEILRLTTRQFFLYLRNIDKLEAHKQLLAIEAISFPQMKKSDREELKRHYIVITEGRKSTQKKRVDKSWSVLRTRRKLDARSRRSNSTSKT